MNYVILLHVSYHVCNVLVLQLSLLLFNNNDPMTQLNLMGLYT